MHIQRLAPSHAPVFLVNSRYPLVCATPKSSHSKCVHHRGSPLNRRNGSDLPSSLTRIRSILWYSLPDHQCRFGVRAALSLTPKLFSAAGITGYRAIRPPSSHLGPMRDGFACPTPCVLDHGRPPPRPATLLRHSCADLLQGSVPTGQGIPPPKEQ